MLKFLHIALIFILTFFWDLSLKAQCSANFTVDTAACSGENVTFTSNSQVAGNVYNWDFGDIASGSSNFDTTASPAHTYKKRGVYTVTLIITRGSTCRDSVAKKIRIFQK